MALIQTKVMIRPDASIPWYDISIVPPQYYEFEPVSKDLGNELSSDGLTITEYTEWFSVETWEENKGLSPEWQPTYDYWAANEITVTWTLVDDSTGEVIGTFTKSG